MKLHPKTPLSFVLALLVNIILIVSLEIALLYTFPGPPSAQALAEVDPRYENCRIYGEINTDSSTRIHFYRVLTQDGQTDIVPLQQHSFFPSRSKLRQNKILKDIDLKGQDSHQILLGTDLYTVFISNGAVHAGRTGGGASVQTALTKYLGSGAVLAFFEMLLLEKLKGN